MIPQQRWPSLPAGPSGWALFLDIDGALLDLAATPGAVVATPDTLSLIDGLARSLGGAIAMLSGRSIDDLDRIFEPVRLPCAGVHGAELRLGNRQRVAVPVDRDFLVQARREAAGFVQEHPGTLLEDKGVALALHTRHAIGAFDEASRLLSSLAARSAGRFSVQGGKHVHELKPALANKGAALLTFMAESPFLGRRPLVFGDDLTDADAFRAALTLGGVSVGVGADAPPASFRLDTPSDCRRWLRDWVAEPSDLN